MPSVKVNQILTVNLVWKTAHPGMVIIEAVGQNDDSNMSHASLSPVDKKMPTDGIWEFAMVGDVHGSGSHVVTKVNAQTVWPIPRENAIGVKVSGVKNSVTVKLRKE